MSYEWHQAPYTISTDPSRLDLELIKKFLHDEAYWATGRAPDVIERSIAHSENFGVYRAVENGNEAQVGFGRVISDYATFAYLSDVFILPHARGHGLGKWLMQTILSHPELQGMRFWYLRTRDAHGFYKQFGFTELRNPERSMERPGNL